MGLVFKQSSRNLLITITGFAIGAINVLFLYTHILEDKYFGLVTFILAFSSIMMPLMAFGMQNAMLRFFSQLDEDRERNQFLTFVFFFPLGMAGLWALFLSVFYTDLAGLLTQRNPIVGDYLWYIFGIGLSMAYFELGYAYAKVQLKSVLGTGLKEIFVRLCISLLLIGVYFEWLNTFDFLGSLVFVYAGRAVLMWISALGNRRPDLDFGLASNYREILFYGLLMLLGTSASIIILEIDKVMLNSYLILDEVAYYGVAIYIATVIAMPYRAMYHISAPLTASYINQERWEELRLLYQRSSLSLFTVSGIIYFLIAGSLTDLYSYLPAGFGNLSVVVYLVGFSKLTDNLTGTANSIMFYSPYYKYMLAMGIGLSALTVGLNLWLIPIFGSTGCGLATMISVLMYNASKVLFIRFKFGFWPGTPQTLYTALAIAIFFLLAIGLPLPEAIPAWIRIVLRSAVLISLFILALWYFKFSPELREVLAVGMRKLGNKKSHDH